MDLNQYLLALRARRKTFLLVFAATVLTAVAVALIVPKRYDAQATVLVDARDEQTLSPARLTPRERAGYMHTQIDLLLSGKVANRVVRDLKLAHQPGMREEFERATGGMGSIEDWIAAQLVKNLRVDAGASNILIIEYKSNDPRKAAEVANGFAKAYMDVSLQMRTEPTREAAEWFEDQVKVLRSQVQQQQTRLADYQKKNGITGVDERMDIEYARLTELSSALSTARTATTDAQSRHEQARALAAAASVDTFPEVFSNTYLSAIRGDLQRAQARVDELGTVYGENHPALQRAKLEADGLRERLASETKKLVAGFGASAAQAKKREEELAAALAAQQQRILKLRDARVEMAVMMRDVDNAQRSYDAALARHASMRLESRANQTNLALLTPAVEPIEHAQPKVGLIAILSVLVGALLGAGIVYLMELLDRRVRSRTDLEARLAVPTLGGLSRWQPMGGRLLPAPMSPARALPHPW